MEIQVPCQRCGLVYYCSKKHMQIGREEHRYFCRALEEVAQNNGGQIFRNCGVFTTDEFRSYRLVILRQLESILDRSLTINEKEVILFPRICNDTHCRLHTYKQLEDCKTCSQVAFCLDKPQHAITNHAQYCQYYCIFKQLIVRQQKFGRIEPNLPSKVLNSLPVKCMNTLQFLQKLSTVPTDPCEYAIVSQLTTAPFTAWYALKLCKEWQKSPNSITIHIIGAEFHFEVDYLQKWEIFFMHIVPSIQKLNIIFIGPELNATGVNIDDLTKTKSCLHCKTHSRIISYQFKCQLYHEYVKDEEYLQPQLICFFNAGLYRYTGFLLEDSWPETILAASEANCPIVVTSYTQYEAPLDLMRLLQEANRAINIVLPPTINPFTSTKPERNFISDHQVPIIFKNYFTFVVQ